MVMDHHTQIRLKMTMNLIVQLIIDRTTKDEKEIHLENDIFLEEIKIFVREMFDR